jgi:ketosteroid isomerase-like protein
MRNRNVLVAVLLAASLWSAACEQPAANNTATTNANRAANANTNGAKPDRAAIESEIRKLMNDGAAAMSRNDAAAFESMTTPDYMFINPNGVVQTRDERAASMRSGESKLESVVYDELNVRIHPEGNGALVVGRATVKGVNMGTRVDGQYRVTQVWTKMPDRWSQVHSQATPITAAAPAARTGNVNSNTSTNTSTASPPANN